MGRTGSGKSHPISKSLQTNASPGSIKIELGLFVFASLLISPHLRNRAAYLFGSIDVKASDEHQDPFRGKCCQVSARPR